MATKRKKLIGGEIMGKNDKTDRGLDVNKVKALIKDAKERGLDVDVVMVGENKGNYRGIKGEMVKFFSNRDRLFTLQDLPDMFPEVKPGTTTLYAQDLAREGVIDKIRLRGKVYYGNIEAIKELKKTIEELRNPR